MRQPLTTNPDHTASADSLKTVAMLRDLLTEHYPLKRRQIDWGKWEDISNETLAQNKLLHAAFDRYAEAVTTRPDPMYQYIEAHVPGGEDPAPGLTKKEWTIYATGLALRVLPTTSQLMQRDSRLRARGFNTRAYTANLGHENGTNGDASHVQLLFESLHQMGQSLKLELPEDIETYEMVYQLVRLRKMGITFEAPLETPEHLRRDMLIRQSFQVSKPNEQMVFDILRYPDNQEFHRFEDVLKEQKISLPHQAVGFDYDGAAARHIRAPWAIPQAYNKMRVVTQRDPMGFPLAFDSMPVPKSPGDALPHFYLHYMFEKAQRIAALLPDQIIDYRQQTEQGVHFENEKLQALYDQLDVATREGSAADKSHLKGYHHLVQRYLGLVPTPAEKKKAIGYSQEHVGAQGVEPVHTQKVLELLSGLVMTHHAEPELLTQALNTEVDTGYLAQQRHHSQVVAQAMGKAREQAAKGDDLDQLLQTAPYISGGFMDGLQQVNRHLQGRIAHF